MTFLRILAALAALMLSAQASAITIRFDRAEVPTIQNLDDVTNQWAAFGVMVSNAYWYTDSRDPFDQMGLSVCAGFQGQCSGNTARIDITGGTSEVTVDWWSITGDNIISAYNSSNVLQDTFTGASGGFGTETLNGDIAYITWHDTGGFVQISTLTFEAPEPATLALLGIALAGLGLRRRKVVAN